MVRREGVHSRSVLRAANNETTERDHRSKPPVLQSLTQARSVNSGFSVFPAGLAIPASQGPDWVGRVAACVAAQRGPPRPSARYFIGGIARHWGVKHFQRATAGIDLVVMGEIGEAFENAEQFFVP